MKPRLIFVNLRQHWWFLIIISSITIGGIFIKPAFRLLPIILKESSRKLEQVEDLLGRIEDKFPSVIQIDTHNYFLPFIVMDEPQTQISHKEKAIDSLLKAIDFSPTGAEISIVIKPNEDANNSGKPVNISFTPDEHCIYGDGNACIYQFLLSNQNKVIFVSVHSGFGGEGESFRNLVEGTGVNQGLYTSSQVSEIAQTLAGSEVTVNQGNTIINGLTLTLIARIPPESLDTYLTLPIEQTLTYGMALGIFSPEIFNSNVLVIETCGWLLPSDMQNPNYPNTTQSIYLGIIH
jgi:hypothetical protein